MRLSFYVFNIFVREIVMPEHQAMFIVEISCVMRIPCLSFIEN